MEMKENSLQREIKGGEVTIPKHIGNDSLCSLPEALLSLLNVDMGFVLQFPKNTNTHTRKEERESKELFINYANGSCFD